MQTAALRGRAPPPHGCARPVPLTCNRRPRIALPARAAYAARSPPSPAPLPTTTPTPSAALAAPAPTPDEAVNILFAGYSDIAERLQKAHCRIEDLEKQLTTGTTNPLFAAATGRSPWDAALFLLFFLAFINFAGWLALWQAQSAIAAAGPAWWAALVPGGSGLALASRAAAAPPLMAIVLKRLVLFFVPLTNTAVVLTFCAAAIRAALACLRAWE
jgi:hypothetical protein